MPGKMRNAGENIKTHRTGDLSPVKGFGHDERGQASQAAAVDGALRLPEHAVCYSAT
jgi:hypothetical protein